MKQLMDEELSVWQEAKQNRKKSQVQYFECN